MSVIHKCLFPVAGYGTRFLPVTKAIPKEMLPILTKPLIQYGVEEAMSAGIRTMAMVTSKHKQAIENHFKPHLEIESSIQGTAKEPLLDEVNQIIKQCDFAYIEQQEMLGLGHAIYTGKSLIGNKPFAVILPDDLCTNDDDSVLLQMTKLHTQHPDCCIVAIEAVPMDAVDKYGVIDGELLSDSNNTWLVHNMVEKPSPEAAPTNLAIIGRYILTPDIFTVLENTQPDKNGEIQITDALMTLAKKGKVIAYQFQGKRFDCGSVKGFVKATNAFAEKLL
ncbi:UTP--glucose-1-phosphate uridylyltransferase [Bathymodiolus heckerae thiotrophic gill symbiont]|uniref:UTP--glucose-1-phosphate uridylyltransferase GalU n=1 Tax=Bathymodiolus heckerae thiotrophic gill symbiont TaxID=1052212 RepID=UPI0010B87428|nr:UTP--glucose-1-phosphate uridylyltransferase GalU [Bathymodiolus heckerae thiotrophic gill symbiont]CAC9437432.1 UTP--glucose-1-phosphate uridylyltransferase (EC 2.7.7.9) [uncultured Gammaproteobacteria bacterium]SMN13500.1 UTP--glucose-1-phosphate uridylyltransferase [Bathymodiolus heckerae thiotrophic gill symbiont]